MSRRRIVAGLVAGALVLAACGDGDDGAGTPDDVTTTAPEGDDTEGAGGAEEAQEGEVPDPCTLLDQATLTDLMSSDPGAGTLNALVPDQRKICIFESGEILAVELASHYDASVALIREDPLGATISDLDGVGTEAIWQDFGGGFGQLVALGDDYFVGVTVSSGGLDAARAVATAMLAAV